MGAAAFSREALPQDVRGFQKEAQEVSEEQFVKGRPHPFLLYVRSKLWDPSLVMTEAQQAGFGATTRIAEFHFLQGGLSFISPIRKVHTDPDVEGVMLGRSTQNDIIVPVSSVSSEHLIFKGEGSGEEPWSVEDLGSRNGTFHNEDRLEANKPHTIAKKEYLRLGGNLIAWFLSARLMYRVLCRPDIMDKFTDL